MTDNDHSFLQYLIHEDIYLIDHEEAESNELAVEQVRAERPSQKVAAVIEEQAPEVRPTRDIVVLYHNPTGQDMPEADKAYLGKILGAVKKSFDDVQLINTAIDQLTNIGLAKNIIAFDAKSEWINQYSVKYQLIKTSPDVAGDTAQIIKADNLNAISQSPELRKGLWGALQLMFGVG